MGMSAMLQFMLFSAFIHSSSGRNRRLSTCEQGSCYPATGDLLIGRQAQLSASSTCGLERPQRYCVVSYLEKSTKCFICDSRQLWTAGVFEQSHSIQNIVSSFKDQKSRWWQAEAGRADVSIQLDLEAEFHFTHLIMTFKTFRPKAMFIERSFDFGKTWKVYRYFAQNCAKSFPHVPRRVVNRLSDVICEEKYSAETPSTSGEVIFRVLPPTIEIRDPYSEAVQELIKLTNLRINFTELHTLGDTLLDNRPEIKEKYYYALYDVTVRGSCSCYGHASRCLPVPGFRGNDEDARNMVHGMCECTHNTKGLNCQQCEDFYHDHPWGPARRHKPNVCKKCNCNNHATECHFDAARFQASGGMSGGVCDNCMHNTRGINCQECKPFYFQDPRKDIRDPNICQTCDCDTHGTLNRGECEQITDDAAKTVAGRCVCKAFVTGDRCDRCVENYWNLQADNHLGCQPCMCNTQGTVPDIGCDVANGACKCKRFVTSKNCDTCYPGFYGLSADNQYGCNACDCDMGGAVKSSCDQQTGQCQCRLHIRGKQCKQVDPGFFYAHLDYYTYEAEYGRGIGNAHIHIQAPSANVSTIPWTGPGHMKVMEGDSLEVIVSGLPFGTYYDILIRYDSKMPSVFSDVRISIIRPGQVKSDGPCHGFNPREDLKSVSLLPGVRYQIVPRPTCFEKGTTYTIRLDFHRYTNGRRHPEATVFIDSIVLLPTANYVPIYQGEGLPEYMKNDFLNNKCDVLQRQVVKPELSDKCQKHIFSISAVLHNGALDCDCDRVGSISLECNPSGGQCHCRPNIVGRRCDQCAPGTFGFGPRGCSPCNCHEFGARDKFCNEQTGQCTCVQNLAGRVCDQCQSGYWGFPQCRPCQCNAHTDRCDQLTGACIGCNGFTAGVSCERCKFGYYGDPRTSVNISCRPCLCPGGPASSTQHADTCSWNPRTNDVQCNCKPGYTGRSCDVCMDNYFGAPTQLGGQCRPCACNKNVNPDHPDNCNRTTGECLRCLFNSEGFACEHCRSGYYGDASKQNCARCVCHRLGTEPGECDRVTGQCRCLPNVVGQRCDQCAVSYWNIASRKGCSSCDCDLGGSATPQCNQLTGQCTCLSGRGGSRCTECQNAFYGDPNLQCFPCDCDPRGSRSLQCDRRTGQCMCAEGVIGKKCDRCARGTTGVLPNCVPCGQCFNNWEKVIQEIREQTHNAVEQAKGVTASGALRTFDADFQQMQNDIDDINKILYCINNTNRGISGIGGMLETIENKMKENILALNQAEEDCRAGVNRVRRGDFRIEQLKYRVRNIKTLAKELRDNITNVKIQEIGGASDEIKQAQLQSRAAQKQVDSALQIVAQSQGLRTQTERLLNASLGAFQDRREENIWELNRLEYDIMMFRDDLSDINTLMCGQSGDPCSALCGGGGCGRCGGDGCSGAVTVSQTALDIALKAEDLLNAKTRNATEDYIPRLLDARSDAGDAKSDAQMAFDEVARASIQIDQTKVYLDSILNKVTHFLSGTNASSPGNVEQIAREVLAMEVPLKLDQIKEVANKIGQVVGTLTDIDKVLEESAEYRTSAMELQQLATETFDEAKTIHLTAREVSDAMEEALTVQDAAEQSIEEVRSIIRSIEADLDMIDEDTGNARYVTSATAIMLGQLKERLDLLARRYVALKMDTLDKAERAAEEANRLANEALDKADGLESNHEATSHKLKVKHNETAEAVILAGKLKDRAEKLFQFTSVKMAELKGVQDSLDSSQERLTTIHNNINNLSELMDQYLEEIRDRAKAYETC